jgi:hypothetical protein
VKIEDLTLAMIASQMHLTTSRDIVAAVVWAARLGWADTTCYAFVTALVMTDTLQEVFQWPLVLKKIENLKIAADLAALEAGKVITRDVE